MKKTCRAWLSILLVLLLLTSLPISAMADGETHITVDTENNTTSNAIIDKGVNVTTNSAPVVENNGNIGTSNAPITTNTSTGEVGTANASVYTNEGKVEDSKAYIETNTGTVTDNNGRINESSGTVVNNNSMSGIGTNTGTVTNSAGFIQTNNGQVGTVGTQGQAASTSNTNLVNNQAVKNEDGTYQEGTGVVDVNYGFLVNNGDYNAKDKDSGTLNTNEGIVNGNYGTITTNNGHVDSNYAVITENQGEINYASGNSQIGTNGEDAYISVNQGKIDTNDGTINVNPGGTIGTNNGTVNDFAYGKIETNNGVINECWSGSIVTENNGTINDGKSLQVVTNGITGVVNDTGASTVENNFGTYNCSDGNTYLGLSWGSDTKSLTLLDGEVVKGTQKNLDEAAAKVTAAGPTRDGYKLTGYTWLTSDGAKVTDTANYTMNAPTWLKLLWEKIVTAVAPAPASSDEPEAKPVKAAAIPTTVEAEDVKVGTVVRAKGQLFKVIEMDDGSITVVTMGALSKKDMEDLMVYLAKYLTPEQIELLLGNPELISQELAAKLFGGNTNHIVFKAAKNLFAK